MLALLNLLLPAVIGLYKELRNSNPDQPSLTDEQIVDLLHSDSTEVVNKAKTWLASHPASPPQE